MLTASMFPDRQHQGKVEPQADHNPNPRGRCCASLPIFLYGVSPGRQGTLSEGAECGREQKRWCLSQRKSMYYIIDVKQRVKKAIDQD